MYTKPRLYLTLMIGGAVLSAVYPVRDTAARVVQAVQTEGTGQDPASRGSSTLQAGFGRADITPPPGYGLQGYSLAANVARGYRLRLYARALVLEDGRGERLALVAADLGQGSLLLHHEVAAAVVTETGIGPDRLILAATHTHAGPGHFFAADLLNKYGTPIEGYDPQLADLLSRAIARAVKEAFRSRRPAVAAWGQAPVWGHTRNRSHAAYQANDPPAQAPFSLPVDRQLSLEEGAVDPTWTMLRVDTLDREGRPVPAGALSLFAIHGTGNPASNDLYDADIHGMVSRRIERYIDDRNGTFSRTAPRAVHLFFNGPQGDVSANWPPESRCEPFRLVRGQRPAGPRTPLPLDRWYSPTRRIGAPCLGAARAYMDSLSDSLSTHAIQLYERLGDDLRGDVTIRRAFRTVPLHGRERTDTLLCPEPRIGTAFAAGAEDGRSQAYKWKVFWLLPLGIEEGGGAIRPGYHGCHTPKRLGISYWVQGKFLVKTHGLPRTAQLSALQVGDMLLGVMPAEVTTTAGFRIAQAMKQRAETAGLDVAKTAIVGLANGDLRYLTTPEEYNQQHYEGGSMLYGPHTAVVFSRLLSELVDSLAAGGSAHVDPYPMNPGDAVEIVDFDASEFEARSFEEAYCRRDTAIVRWLDAAPGSLIPADGPVIELALERANGERLEIWDDDPNLEVRAIRDRGKKGYLWEARWTPPGGSLGDYEVRLARGAPNDRTEFSCR